MNAFLELTLISLAVSLFSQGAYFLFSDVKKVSAYRERIKEISRKIRKLDPSSNEYKSLFNEQLKINSQIMRMNMKPMIITTIPLILVFTFLNKRYTGVEVIPLPFSLFGKTYLGWLGTYIILSLVFTSVIQKVVFKYLGERR